MYIKVEINEQDLREMVAEKIERVTNTSCSAADVEIEVKSKQNFKSEWEVAAFRAVFTKAG